MGGPADQDIRPYDVPGVRHRKVTLAEVQDIGSGCERHVRAVVDGEQGAVPPCDGGEHGQSRKFVACVHRTQLALAGRALVAELDDVDTTGQRGFRELCQVTLLASSVGTQVQTRRSEATPTFCMAGVMRGGHGMTVASTVKVQHGSPGIVGLRGAHAEPDCHT